VKILDFVFNLSLIDQNILVLTIAGYCIVLLSLALMAYIFIRLHFFQDYFANRRLKKKNTQEATEKPKPAMTGEENAAIAAALYLFFSEMHDEEKYVMTIKKVSRNYSPWSSKIYGVFSDIR
jgi:Na+-transporting methylmalonyl-CoA/oxaloacetate decarboxylase gamma subunit